VRWVDPAPAIARRVVELVGPAEPGNEPLPAQAFFTSGREPTAALTDALVRFGLNEITPARAFDTSPLSP
jgi:glutamate racemase